MWWNVMRKWSIVGVEENGRDGSGEYLKIVLIDFYSCYIIGIGGFIGMSLGCWGIVVLLIGWGS